MMVFFLLAISLVPLTLGNELTKNFAPTILFLYVVFGFIFINRARNLLNFMSPNSLIFFYSSLSLLLGSWAYKNGYVFVYQDQMDFLRWRKMDVSLSVIMISLSVMVITDDYFRRRMKGVFQSYTIKTNRSLMLSGLILVPFFFTTLDLDMLGAQGDLSIIPKTILAMFCIISCQRLENKFLRWTIYIFLIIVFATFSIADKRDSIFLIFPAIYLEFARKKITLTPMVMLWALLIITFLLGLILTMSVARGYGNYGQFTTLTDAFPFLLGYLKSDDFIPGFFANIEVNYFFFHALNAIELIVNNPELISFGSTIIKPLFFLVPRNIAEWKPDSIIHLYTSLHAPDIRAIGGSWPISIFSEFFWNFYFFSPLFVLVFSAVLAKFQLETIKLLCKNDNFKLAFFIFGYMNLIILARGSGFDQYVVFVILGGASILICKIFLVFLSSLLVMRSESNRKFNNNERVKRK